MPSRFYLRISVVTIETRIEGTSERSLAAFAERARAAVRLDGSVNVLVTGNARIRLLNRLFRDRDEPTDVLSFPAGARVANRIAGDIAISAPIAAVNARRLGHSLREELRILVLHGMLHLAGYDHDSDNGKMARKEEQLRRKLGLPDGLIARSEAGGQTPTRGRRESSSRNGQARRRR